MFFLVENGVTAINTVAVAVTAAIIILIFALSICFVLRLTDCFLLVSQRIVCVAELTVRLSFKSGAAGGLGK